jgi:hypothetical protein
VREGVHFFGVGDDGNRAAAELYRMYDGMVAVLFDREHNDSQNGLHIHSYPITETVCCDGADQFIILAGSVHEPCWQEARKTLRERRPFLMLTIGTGFRTGVTPNFSPPFNDECLVIPDPSNIDPVEVAQLALQIFFIHMPWNVCKMGSLIGYDFADTKQLFAGKVTKFRKMTSDKDHYRQDFSKFINENQEDLSRANGILMSFWGRDDVLSIPKVNELMEEMKRFVMPEADLVFTFHMLPENGLDFMATLYF